MPSCATAAKRSSTSSVRTERMNAAIEHDEGRAARRNRARGRRLHPRHSRPAAASVCSPSRCSSRCSACRSRSPSSRSRSDAGETGEEAVAKAMLEKQQATPGWIDIALADRQPCGLPLCGDPLPRADQGARLTPWYGVLVATMIVAAGVRGEPAAHRLGAGHHRAAVVRARAARALPARDVREPAGRYQPADGLSRHRHQRAARQHAADRDRRRWCRSSSWARC